jgi:hypothetical protein
MNQPVTLEEVTAARGDDRACVRNRRQLGRLDLDGGVRRPHNG